MGQEDTAGWGFQVRGEGTYGDKAAPQGAGGAKGSRALCWSQEKLRPMRPPARGLRSWGVLWGLCSDTPKDELPTTEDRDLGLRPPRSPCQGANALRLPPPLAGFSFTLQVAPAV